MTPYLHAFIAHIPDHLRFARKIEVPLTNLSTEPVEKKNHAHVKFYFGHTTMGGGKGRISALNFLMRKENRALYSVAAQTSTTTTYLYKKIL